MTDPKDIPTDQVGQKFKDRSFSTSDLRGMEFYNCTFTNCIISEIDLADSKYYNTTFTNCNFSNSKYTSTQFRDVTFIGCKLIGAGFSEKNFAFSANFTECDLRYAEFSGVHLSKKSFHLCRIDSTRFANCNLSGSMFSGSSFQNTIFLRCNLQNAVFIESEYLFINPLENRVKNTSIDIMTTGNIIGHFGFIIE